jgi:cell division protein FtsB
MAREKRFEVDRKRVQLAAEEQRLTELKVRRDCLREWKAALESDPVAVEEAIRRKLRWVRPGERVLAWKPVTTADEGTPPPAGGG